MFSYLSASLIQPRYVRVELTSWSQESHAIIECLCLEWMIVSSRQPSSHSTVLLVAEHHMLNPLAVVWSFVVHSACLSISLSRWRFICAPRCECGCSCHGVCGVSASSACVTRSHAPRVHRHRQQPLIPIRRALRPLLLRRNLLLLLIHCLRRLPFSLFLPGLLPPRKVGVDQGPARCRLRRCPT